MDESTGQENVGAGSAGLNDIYEQVQPKQPEQQQGVPDLYGAVNPPQPPEQHVDPVTGQKYNEPEKGFADQQPDLVGVADMGAQGTPQSKPVDYKFQYPEGYSEEGIGNDIIADFKKAMHRAGSTNAEAQRQLNSHFYWLNRIREKELREYEQKYNHWRQESTSAGLLHPQTTAAANRALSLVDPNGELRQILSASGLQFNPAILRLLADYGRRNTQDRGTLDAGITQAPERERTQEEKWKNLDRVPYHLI